MKDFFSSDHHFFHDKIIGFSGRPVTSISQMHEKMIHDHNSVVTNNDRWYCLGDFSFGTPEESESILRRLNGQKFLVKGNHDHRKRRVRSGWAGPIESYNELRLEHNGEIDHIVLCHFPMLTWHKVHHGSFMLHGHSHGNLTLPKEMQHARIFDVGVDHRYRLKHDYRPWEWSELRARIMAQVKGGHFKGFDHHEPQEEA